MKRVRILKEAIGYTVGQWAELPDDVAVVFIREGIAAPFLREEPETEMADRRGERAVTRGRGK